MSRTSTEPEPEDGEKVEEMRAQLIEVVRKNNELQRRNEELERKDFERERQMAGEQDFVLQRMYSGPGHEIVEVIGTVPSKASMTAAHLMPMASAPARSVMVPSLKISSSLQGFVPAERDVPIAVPSQLSRPPSIAGVELAEPTTPRVLTSGPSSSVTRMVSTGQCKVTRMVSDGYIDGSGSPREHVGTPMVVPSPLVVPRLLSSPYLGVPQSAGQSPRVHHSGGHQGPPGPRRLKSAPMSAFDEAFAPCTVATASSGGRSAPSRATPSISSSVTAQPAARRIVNSSSSAIAVPMSWHRPDQGSSSSVMGRRSTSPNAVAPERSSSVRLGSPAGWGNFRGGSAHPPPSPPAPPQRMVSANAVAEARSTTRFPSPPPPLHSPSLQCRSPRDSVLQAFAHSQPPGSRDTSMRHFSAHLPMPAAVSSLRNTVSGGGLLHSSDVTPGQSVKFASVFNAGASLAGTTNLGGSARGSLNSSGH